MIVVVEDFLKGSFVNDSLVAFEAFALFAFEGFHGYGPEFDSVNGSPWLRVPFLQADAVESGVEKCLQKLLFGERARNAPGPKIWIVLHFFGHRLIADNI